jgi:arylsulfatase A
MRYVSLLLFLCLTVPVAGSAQEATASPNILLILLDDAGLDAIGPGAEGAVATPHIEALANRGATFTHAFATPVCTPSRVQLLTGQYPFRNGVQRNLFTYPLAEQCVEPPKIHLAGWLAQHGYRTSIAGKWQLCRFEYHQRPNHPQEWGFQESLLWTWRVSGDKKEQKKSRYWAPSLWPHGGPSHTGSNKEFGPDLYLEHLLKTIESSRSGLITYSA